MEKTINCCCFTGHRAEKLPWRNNESDPRCIALKQKISDVIFALYRDGFRRFYCGMASGCDLYFGEAVIALRDEHPEVELEAVIPYDGQASQWDRQTQKRYYRLAENADRCTVLHSQYTPDCMMERNRYMVDHSDILIAVYSGCSGGTQNTMLYAIRSQKRILEIPLS